MLPIGDNVPTRRFPVAVFSLLCLYVALYLVQTFSADGGAMLINRLGFVPADLLAGERPPFDPDGIPVGARLLTYGFLHGSWAHLAGNMVYLWIFADDVEDAVGHAGFVVFFLLCGAIAACVHAWPAPDAVSPVVGASGCVSGVLGAFLVLHPRAEIRIAVPFFLVVEIVTLPAWVVLLAWFVLEFSLRLALGPEASIAFGAHIGGFLAGFALIPLFAPAARRALRTRMGV